MRNATKVLLAGIITATGGCEVTVGSEDEHYDPADEEAPGLTQIAAIALDTPIPMRSGAWWGDTKTPLINQVWGEVTNATPGKNLTAPYTYQWNCAVPKLDGFSQTLKLTTASFSIDSTVVKSVSNPVPGATQTFTLDPAKYGAGWHEIRIRCKGKETVGGETGEVTAITAGFPVQLRGGTGTYQNHSGTNYVDTHGWYSRGIDYVYATILNISDIVGRPQTGVIALDLKARTSGDTKLDHFMVKVDDRVAVMTNGMPAEFFGATDRRTIYLDTKRWPNGMHRLAMHSHGLEIASSEEPGMQLAAQIEVFIQIQN
jgi:hypothetical protein